MSPTFRAIRSDEIPAAVDVFLLGLADLLRQNGLPFPEGYTRAAFEPVYRHIFETGIFDVAEDAGRISVICNAIVRDEIGFLCMFWALPELKQQGLGGPLLERVLGEARRRGARVLCTWSSVDFAAIATYLKAGMLPGGPILTFRGSLRSQPEAPESFVVRPLVLATASRIDQTVRGTARPRDHAFWHATGNPGYQVEVEGQAVGYFYSHQGAIGPAAWLNPEQGPGVLARALETARGQAPEVKFITFGSNATAIQTAMNAGLRLVGSAHWMRSAAFGKLEQYLPSGPALL